MSKIVRMGGQSFLLLCAFCAFFANAKPAFPKIVVPITICPSMVLRTAWGARNAVKRIPMEFTPVPYIVIHHGSIMTSCNNKVRCSELMRIYQDMHMEKQNWHDIGYSFAIGEDGNVYEGSGWSMRGSHTSNYNSQSIGILMMGNFEKKLPNDAALKALNLLISCGVRLGLIYEDYHLVGHNQTQPTNRLTPCPGEALYEYLKRMPRWIEEPMPFVYQE